MIRSKFFLKYALIGSVLAIALTSLSMLLVGWIRDVAIERSFRTVAPIGLVDSLLSGLTPETRLNILRDLEISNPPPGPPPNGFSGRPPGGPGRGGPPFCLTNSAGEIIYPARPFPDLKVHASAITKKLIASGKDVLSENEVRVVRLPGEPVQFFVALERPPRPPRDSGFVLMVSMQAAALVLAIVITIFILIYTLRSRARLAENVIHDLSHGNLKARFPITKMDEVGQVMFSFNKMADEIEHLIDSLRKSESTRKDLLRQLAHDLRTPIASIKSLIEIVKDRFEQLSPEKRNELLDTTLKEADYFQGLVDDLLFLGAVNEPHYNSVHAEFDVIELFEEELQAMKFKYPDIKVDLKIEGEVLRFNGDQALLKRLLRNAVENAYSFAQKEVRVSIDAKNNHFEIKIEDDGPGFSPDALASFGQRKFSRAVPERGNRRISIGLGSVIMKSIAEAYRGQVIVNNLTDSRGAVVGAQLRMILPKH